MSNLNKILFTSSLVIGTTITISSYSWLGMWMGLEINLLSIAPLMSSTKNMLTNEATLKYFITQALASTILLFSIIIMSTYEPFSANPNIIILALNTSLLTKMGAAPFHFWFPEVMEGLSWNNCLIMLTWQKIAPMVILTYTSFTLMFLSIVAITSLLIGGIMGLNQTSMRKILAYSSINHVGWMISALMLNEMAWVVYFITYTIISTNIIVILKSLNIFYVKQLIANLNEATLLKLFFALNFLSLGGLPPFLGFLPKWITIQLMTDCHLYALAVTMAITTLITVYFYLRITFSTILLTGNSPTINVKTNINKFSVWTSNFIAITSLIFCTLIFNLL